MERSQSCNIYDANNNKSASGIIGHLEGDGGGGEEGEKGILVTNNTKDIKIIHLGASNNISTSLPAISSIRKTVKRQASHNDYCPDPDEMAYAADIEDDDVIMGDHCATTGIHSNIITNPQSEFVTVDRSPVVSDSPDVLDTNSMSPTSRRRRRRIGFLIRDNSLHSDSSRYSSVDSLLEARKPDPEAILINLGFGPVGSEDILSRIPKRFLKPSQVRGIDTEAFVRRLQLASNLHDHSVLGYRGLTGNPDVPPSSIVAKIMERFEVNQRKKSLGPIEQTI